MMNFKNTQILTEEKITKIVKDWDANNSEAKWLKKEGIFNTGNSFGSRACIEIDTRTGKIGTHTHVPGTGRFSEIFFIELCNIELSHLDDDEICCGDDRDEISAQDFVEKRLKKDWSEYVDNYSDGLLENIRIDYDAISEFYTYICKMKEQEILDEKNSITSN